MKRIKIWCCFLLSLSLLSGCKFVRPTDADKLKNDESLENVAIDDGKIPLSDLLKPNEDETQTVTVPITENPVSIVIDHGENVDVNSFVEYFFGESTDDLQEEGDLQATWSNDESYIQEVVCFKDNIELVYERKKDGRSRFWAWNHDGDAGYRYEEAIDKFTSNEISQRLMDLYPEEDLELCSREEAIAFCAPLAEACGYKDAKVSVYALTKEVLNDYPERARTFTNAKELEPPYSNMEKTVSMADIIAAQDAGDEELAKALEKKWKEELERENGVWTDEFEAYLLVYRLVLNGRLLDSTYFSMRCIYVPAYEKVVYVYGESSVAVVETLEEVALITEEEALAEALRVARIDSVDKITLKGISMVYSPRYEQANPSLERRVIDPCWRIDYQLSEELMNNATVAVTDDGTILINAVDGRENKYPRG